MVDPAKADAGAKLVVQIRCVDCHGGGLVPGGMAPDLRESSVPLSQEAFFEVVHNGALKTRGMPDFPDLSAEEIEQLRHYIRRTAREAIKGQAPGDTSHIIHQ